MEYLKDNMRILRILFVLLALSAPADAWRGGVVRVVDGDTLRVTTESGSGVRIRLYGIDCPERSQPGGKEATEYVKSVIGRIVEIEEINHDRYGRSVAIVTTENGQVLNQRILESGWAWVYLRYCWLPVCEKWEKFERAAKERGLGLWRCPDPIAPWEWRRK